MNSDPIKLAIYRCETFDLVTFKRWLLVQPPTLVKTAELKPPNRVYEGPGGALVFIRGYGKDGHVVLGFIDGDEGADIHADPSELKDVTDGLRREFGLIQ